MVVPRVLLLFDGESPRVFARRLAVRTSLLRSAANPLYPPLALVRVFNRPGERVSAD